MALCGTTIPWPRPDARDVGCLLGHLALSRQFGACQAVALFNDRLPQFADLLRAVLLDQRLNGPQVCTCICGRSRIHPWWGLDPVVVESHPVLAGVRLNIDVRAEFGTVFAVGFLNLGAVAHAMEICARRFVHPLLGGSQKSSTRVLAVVHAQAVHDGPGCGVVRVSHRHQFLGSQVLKREARHTLGGLAGQAPVPEVGMQAPAYFERVTLQTASGAQRVQAQRDALFQYRQLRSQGLVLCLATGQGQCFTQLGALVKQLHLGRDTTSVFENLESHAQLLRCLFPADIGRERLAIAGRGLKLATGVCLCELATDFVFQELRFGHGGLSDGVAFDLCGGLSRWIWGLAEIGVDNEPCQRGLRR